MSTVTIHGEAKSLSGPPSGSIYPHWVADNEPAAGGFSAAFLKQMTLPAGLYKENRLKSKEVEACRMADLIPGISRAEALADKSMILTLAVNHLGSLLSEREAADGIGC